MLSPSRTIPHHVHLIGIGGAGMGAIAHYLLDLGCRVSGSDLRSTPTATALAQRGARVAAGHDAGNIAGAELVVVSDAIPFGNSEILAARNSKIELVRRADFLRQLCTKKTVISVAGAHGKTTTSSLIARALESSNAEPSYIIGASATGLRGGCARAAAGVHLVMEACEAFRGLKSYRPDVAVITNIDDDHLEHYGSQAALDAAFIDFANSASKHHGLVIAHGDDAGVRRVRSALAGQVMTFGLSPQNDVSAADVRLGPAGSSFLLFSNGETLGRIETPMLGAHAVQNALGCAATCLALGFGVGDIATALKGFTGPARRWDDRGTVGGVRIIDDFAHHPTELRASIAAARLLMSPGDRLLVAFQPQVIERTRRLAAAFAEVIGSCDGAFLLPVYCGADKYDRIGSEAILNGIDAWGRPFHLYNGLEELIAAATLQLRKGDHLLIAGDGDIHRAAPLLVDRLADRGSRFSESSRSIACGGRGNGLQSEATDLLSRIRARAIARPDAPAVHHGGLAVSYGDIETITDRIAVQLIEMGLRQGAVVALGLPPSIDHVCCQIATLKAGAAYLPLDEKLPSRRLSYMIETAKAAMLITNRASPVDECIVHTCKFYFDELVEAAQSRAATEFKRITPPRREDIALICFTSGSTGRPKGIPITHAALQGLMSDALDRFEFGDNGKTALNSSLNFDASVAEIMMTLCAGGTVVIPEEGRTLLGRQLSEFLARNDVTHLLATPSVLATLPLPIPECVRVIIAGGEVCPQSLADRFSGDCAFFNAYGPSEATIYSTAWRYEADARVSIGKPLAHVDLQLVDGHRRAVGAGEVGEITLSGAGVCSGYLGDMTPYADKFVDVEEPDGRPKRVYRTGDLGRWRPDGNLEFLGRIDHQVKIRGNRIELEEIEVALRSLAHIGDAAVSAEPLGDDPRLVAYCTRLGKVPIDKKSVVAGLSEWLPGYMIPAEIVEVDEIPLGATGKKDRAETSRRYGYKTRQPARFVPPRTESEKALGQIWRETLELDRNVGLADDFTQLGGDSLKQTLLMLEIEARLGVDVPVGYFGTVKTLAEMAERLDELLTNPPTKREDADKGFVASDIYARLKEFTANWSGVRCTQGSLIVSAGPQDARYQLFWCLQNGLELEQLSKKLGADFRVHGMRSGHLVMDYTQENVSALSSHYADEIAHIWPEGRLFLGGNCQGGQIAHAVALLLKERGRIVSHLILLEQARFPPYGDAISFIYGEESFLNPVRRYGSLASYDCAYPQGYTVDIIPGKHGSYFREPNVTFLTSKIETYVQGALKLAAAE